MQFNTSLSKLEPWVQALRQDRIRTLLQERDLSSLMICRDCLHNMSYLLDKSTVEIREELACHSTFCAGLLSTRSSDFERNNKELERSSLLSEECDVEMELASIQRDIDLLFDIDKNQKFETKLCLSRMQQIVHCTGDKYNSEWEIDLGRERMKLIINELGCLQDEEQMLHNFVQVHALCPLFDCIRLRESFVIIDGRRLALKPCPLYNLNWAEINCGWSCLCSLLCALRARNGLSRDVKLQELDPFRVRCVDSNKGISSECTSMSLMPLGDRALILYLMSSRQSLSSPDVVSSVNASTHDLSLEGGIFTNSYFQAIRAITTFVCATRIELARLDCVVKKYNATQLLDGEVQTLLREWFPERETRDIALAIMLGLPIGYESVDHHSDSESGIYFMECQPDHSSLSLRAYCAAIRKRVRERGSLLVDCDVTKNLLFETIRLIMVMTSM
jgi:hypothetical protein